MEKWRAGGRFLRYSPLFLPRLNPNFDYSICNSAFGLGNYQLHNETQKWKFHHCFRFNRASMEKGIIGNGVRLQFRGFGSVATKVERNPLFSTLNSDDVQYFKRILGDKNVIEDEDRLLASNMDWMHKYRGSSKLLLQPRSTEEVSQILNYCNSRSLAVVPQGGNTGLVGGSVPVHDEVIINVGLMNNIISFDKNHGCGFFQ